jgi:hypothetical protein
MGWAEQASLVSDHLRLALHAGIIEFKVALWIGLAETPQFQVDAVWDRATGARHPWSTHIVDQS